MTLVPLPALADNYILMLHDGSRAIVADPVSARPKVDTLAKCPPQLAAILVTHHDADRLIAQRRVSFGQVAEPAGPAQTPSSTRCKASHAPGRPALPLRMGTRCRMYPHLRYCGATVIAAAHRRIGLSARTGKADFASALRPWKYDFR